jgi:hypothetical protein
MKRRTWFVSVLGVALVLGAAPPGAAVAASSAVCPSVTWGSMPKSASYHPTTPIGHLVDVRAGRHDCYDRMVLDVDGITAGFNVQYVPDIYSVGRGDVIPVRGGAKLGVVVSAPSYDDEGRATYRPADPQELVNVNGYQTFRQLVDAGSFEGETALGVGVRARLPFRVFAIDESGTTRIVIDVAHTW